MPKETYIVVFNDGGKKNTVEVEVASQAGISGAFRKKMKEKKKKNAGIKTYYPKL